MRYFSCTALLCLIFIVSGCSSGPRIDGRDSDAFNTSMDAMELTLNKEQKMRFMLAVIALSGKAQKIKPDHPGSVMRVLLNEKTYGEIIEFTEKAGSMNHRRLEDYYKDRLQMMDKAGNKVMAEDLIVERIASKFIENRNDGRLFMVQGKVLSRMSDSRKKIMVKGQLYTKNQAVASEMSYAGILLDEEQLAGLPFNEIKRQLNTGKIPESKSGIITSGGELPFMIVFSNVSSQADFDEFSVDIAGSDHCSVLSELVDVISFTFMSMKND